MNTPRAFLLVLLATGIACAQDTPTPAPAAAPQSEMQKWIATTDEGWQAVFKRDVTDAYEAEVNKLKLQYLNLLEAAVAKASKASDLDGAVALRNEQKRFSDTEFFPETDDAGDAALVKQIRATLRALLAQAEKNRGTRAKALLAKYDKMLADAQTQLTKFQRLEDALLVKAKREEVAVAWLAGVNTDAVAIEIPKSSPVARPPLVPVKPIAPTKTAATNSGKDVLPTMTEGGVKKDGVIVVSNQKGIKSTGTFQPPLSITYLLKTDDQVRLRYAAEEIIFNWEVAKSNLRVGGGPVHNQHRPGKGAIPVNTFITIHQVVLADKMTISVDGEERGSWEGDFSKVKQNITIMPHSGSTVWVKQVLVNQLK